MLCVSSLNNTSSADAGRSDFLFSSRSFRMSAPRVQSVMVYLILLAFQCGAKCSTGSCSSATLYLNNLCFIDIPWQLYFKKISWGARESLSSWGSSCRWHEFGSQYSYCAAHTYFISPAAKDPMPLFSLYWHHMYVHRHTNVHN